MTTAKRHTPAAAVEGDAEPEPDDVESCRLAWVWLFVGCSATYLLSALIFALFVRAERLDHLLDRTEYVLQSRSRLIKHPSDNHPRTFCVVLTVGG